MSRQPPTQGLVAEDLHGNEWRFRHIFRDEYMDCSSGFIAMYAALVSRDVDCCLIPESTLFLEGPGGLFELIEKRLRENGHMVIVIAEGADEKLEQSDAYGKKIFKDEHFAIR